ncbi:30S ribosomal protein S2 [candidate division WOR-1 bacterium RIFCSPHIGHO2_01_FULL_53_15]|uniref:Small ribosomal subunit protein uS2 n=1 Tax=candidate division WOR-1 bacterium RIFCSPHIGHO2_01_FULL_53_15 TaxID=1802564 RepID=A0A1F4PZ05_UNCSA|nr:MAG: 30S ribosomal protein S2 [candidate division WOR-1 bacterium RIFCSPHIGHO2_01_FULL_53_15]OGC10456.1 MAG: 30S ribosomal protein S2 [candidate division WOR-1 bacterium RIFCSPHIGHO2_02_FULL_53_26]
MPVVTMKELLEAGVHFGHQSKRWNPKMQRYIYSARNGIHVIDLHKSIPLIEKAYEFVKGLAANGSILFVGTKKQAQEATEEEAKRCGMFFVNQRWMGGTLTNFKTLKKNIARLNDIEKMKEDGTYARLPKKEVILLEREHRKLMRGLGGIRQMTMLPAAVFIIDTIKEQTALKEARRLSIPIVAIVDTNTDPDEVDYPIPGNDDAIRSIKLLTKIVADAVIAGREVAKPVEAAAEGGEAGEPIAAPLEVEEAEALTMEQHLEETVLSHVIVPKEAEEEKRVGF